MTKTLSINDVTKTLPDIIESLQSGNYIIVEKNGKPVAGIIDVDDMEDFIELQSHSLKAQVRKGYKELKAGRTVPARPFLQSLKRK